MQDFKQKVHSVFMTSGMPSKTYVERENGRYEADIDDALDSKGKICLITGASKTGKTTLYTKVLNKKNIFPVEIRCSDDSKSMSSILETIAENCQFEGNGSNTNLLIKHLKNTKQILVIEDFHYFSDILKKSLANFCKEISDSEGNIIIVSTTHHASDIVSIRPDLSGRIYQIDVDSWKQEDLEKISNLGFSELEIDISKETISFIAAESVGLPIITQAVCQRMVLLEIRNTTNNSNMLLGDSQAITSLNSTALKDYSHFARTIKIFQRLLNNDQYQIWAKVMSAFMVDPIVFTLNIDELYSRMRKFDLSDNLHTSSISKHIIIQQLINLPELKRQKPPLIEWGAETEELHIIEPSFLYYIRWHDLRSKPLVVTQKAFEILTALRKYKE
jgi:hypothetical protein